MIRETVGNIITAKESILVFRGRKEQIFSGSVGKQVREQLVDPIMIQSIQEAADKSKLPFYLFEAKSGNWLAAVLREMPQLSRQRWKRSAVLPTTVPLPFRDILGRIGMRPFPFSRKFSGTTGVM